MGKIFGVKVTNNWHDVDTYFVQQIMNACTKKSRKTTYFIESSIVEIDSSVLCNSSGNGNNWMKQFIIVDKDLVDAYNWQINFLTNNHDLFKTIIKNTKLFY